MQRAMMSAAVLALTLAGGQALATMCGSGHDRNGAYSNDGAWVQYTAQVADTVKLDRGVSVCHKAKVSGNAVIKRWSTINGHATVSGNAVLRGAHVSGNASISGNAKLIKVLAVGGNARVYGNAKILNDARVFHNSQVYGQARVSGPRAQIRDNAEVFGTAVVRNAVISGNGKVNCGRWVNIPWPGITTDRTGECGRNGKAKILTLPDLPGINPGNTETAE